MTDDPFPYSFDLYFDLKTREDLVHRYAALKSELALIESLMNSHDMKFTTEEQAKISADKNTACVEPIPAPSDFGN